MSNRGSDTPAEIIDYISIQSGCSIELAKKILMAVSGWDGKNNNPVEGLSRFADTAFEMANSVKNIMLNYGFNEDLACQIFFLTQKIINDLSSLDINPDFVLYCVIKTMKNGEINENFAKQFVLKIYDLSLEHPEYITIEFQHKIVDLAVDASQEHNDDLITSLQMIINQLSKGLKEGGKSKKSKSKKYNRKSRGKKHNKRSKRSKSKKIRKS
jgi:hypothetical protein